MCMSLRIEPKEMAEVLIKVRKMALAQDIGCIIKHLCGKYYTKINCIFRRYLFPNCGILH